MTVPDPLSKACELRRCPDCNGLASNLLKDGLTACTCTCHRTRR